MCVSDSGGQKPYFEGFRETPEVSENSGPARPSISAKFRAAAAAAASFLSGKTASKKAILCAQESPCLAVAKLPLVTDRVPLGVGVPGGSSARNEKVP